MQRFCVNNPEARKGAQGGLMGLWDALGALRGGPKGPHSPLGEYFPIPPFVATVTVAVTTIHQTRVGAKIHNMHSKS